MGPSGPGSKQRRQGIFWLLTIPHANFTPWLPPPIKWIRGQLELGEGGFLHWQLIVAFESKCSLSGCRDVFGPFHAELSRSDAASDYVWKESSRVLGTQFELGAKPIRLNSKPDWESIWKAATIGDLESIPPGIRFRSYNSCRSIRSDFARPVAMDRSVKCFWGVTSSGKSHRAWAEAGDAAYSKDPRSKFWCGYSGQAHVVIDEFRGGVDIAHLLRWLDRYPVLVEVKGSSVPYCASSVWITSNLNPVYWYPELDAETVAALLRRMDIEEFNVPFALP